MADPAPAFYSRRGGRVGDWWTLLHPPYTLWHVSYVALGAAMAPRLDWTALGLAALAFLLALGIAAHCLDELQGRPLGTSIGERTLRAVAALSLLGACALGGYGVLVYAPVNWAVLVAVPLGAVLVVGYNLELVGGRLHTDRVFAWGWGGFPVAVGFLAQSPRFTWTTTAAVVAATLAGVGTSHAQRRLSTPARRLRRHTATVTGTITTLDGRVEALDRTRLLTPLEGALRALSWAIPTVSLAVLLLRA